MFNGIIKYTGKVNNIQKNKYYSVIEIYSKIKLSKKEIGSSVSCSGACLTLEKVRKNYLQFYLSKETLDRTNFRNLKKGDVVNLEKSIKFGERVSGHYVQGHVDTLSKIMKISFVGKSWFINFKLLKSHKKYVIEKGSIAINGVSLTISKIFKDSFQIVAIPKTLKMTNLIYLRKNHTVNVEFDVLAKYINSSFK